MKTVTLLSCVMLLLIVSSCRNRNPNLSKEELLAELTREPEKPKEAAVIPEGYQPPSGIKYTAKRDYSEPLVHLDVVSGLRNERTVKLSDFGKEMVYHRIGIFEYGLRDVFIPTEEGILATGTGGVWLLTSDFKKDRLLIKDDAEISQHGEYTMWKPNLAIINLFYDPVTRSLYCLQFQDMQDGRAYQRYVAIASFDRLLESQQPVEIATLTNRVKVGAASGILPVKEGFALYGSSVNGLYTYSATGDTLCHLVPGSEPFEEIKGTTRGAESSNYYQYKKEAYFRLAFTDTVFRLKDASTFQPVYKIDLGTYQATRTEGMKISFDLSDKYLVDNLTETDHRIYLRITRNYDCPNTRKSGDVKFYQLIYDKQSKQLYSFAYRNNLSQPGLIPNDLDGGIGFWPNIEIKGQPYMLMKGKNLKEEMPKGKLEQIPTLQGLDDNEMVLITVK